MDRKDFAAYKQALKEKYEEKRSGRHASFLIAPTSAKLRNLCIQIFNQDNNQNDLQSFLNFFGFRLEESNRQRIANETDKFKPLATFLKGETEIAENNFASAEMLAILLNFKDRPYSNFKSNSTTEQEKQIVTNQKDSGSKTEREFVEVGTVHVDPEPTDLKSISNKKYIQILIAGVLILGAIVLTGKYFVSGQTKCLTWNSDHYEAVDCQGNYPIKPYDKNLLSFRKIAVSETTRFFVDERPVIWYSKRDNQLEYFNAGGEHPVTGKKLKPITRTIIVHHILKDSL